MTHRSRTGGPNIRRQNRKAKQPKQERPKEEPDEVDNDRPGPNDVQLLDLIRRSLLPTLNSPTFLDDCQRVKSLLYDRQWLQVFCDAGLVRVYAGKWVPSRALCYRDLFWHLPEVREYLAGPGTERPEKGDGEEEDEEDEDLSSGIDGLAVQQDEGDSPEDAHDAGSNTEPARSRKHVLSLGGGAGSELLAVGAIVGSPTSSMVHQTDDDSVEHGATAPGYKWTGMDIGPWHSTIDLFSSTVSALHPPATLPSQSSLMEVEYIESDLLSSSLSGQSSGQPSHLDDVLENDPPGLITILFTILELFSQSRSSTIALLRSISQCQPGTLLLVADSASDLGEMELGENGRKWPVYMVLDLMLGVQPGHPSIRQREREMETREMDTQSKRKPVDDKRTRGAGAGAGVRNGQTGDKEADERAESDEAKGPWELLDSSDSRWYRLPEGVGAGWPVKLENTRYWYRLYRRV